ncbi:MAG: glutamine amidotransferase-related protein, partial [Terracidiphilus sp.]
SYAAPGTGTETAAVCNHGFAFAAVIEEKNLAGVQFHPEKSGETGARVLKNFLESVRDPESNAGEKQ